MFRPQPSKLLLSDAGKVVNYSWAQILRHLAKCSVHQGTVNVLEVVFFHQIFPNRPQELCSQNSASGIILQDVRDLTIVDVIRGCALVVNSQSTDDSWSNEPVSIAIKDGKYMELDLMALTRLQKLFPAGTTAVVFSKVAGKKMMPGVFVHEIKRGPDSDKDELRAEGVSDLWKEDKLREYTWSLLKTIEMQLQAKCVNFMVLYKLTEMEEPYIAYVLKCVARPFSPLKRAHIRSTSHPKPPLSVFMSATNPWKSLKTMQLQGSLRPFVVNPGAGVIIQPREVASSQASEPNLHSSSQHSAVDEGRDRLKRTAEKLEPMAYTHKREHRRVVKKRFVLPLIRREDGEAEYTKSMELHGIAFPWRHSKLDLTIA